MMVDGFLAHCCNTASMTGLQCCLLHSRQSSAACLSAYCRRHNTHVTLPRTADSACCSSSDRECRVSSDTTSDHQLNAITSLVERCDDWNWRTPIQGDMPVGKPATVTLVQHKPHDRSSPMIYDISSLGWDAGIPEAVAYCHVVHGWSMLTQDLGNVAQEPCSGYIIKTCGYSKSTLYCIKGYGSHKVAARPVVALGKFDAMHKGHRALAEAAAKLGGPPVLLSFSGMAAVLGWQQRLPLVAACDRSRVLYDWRTVCGGIAPRQRYIPFGHIRSMSPEAFVALLADDLKASGVVVGRNYRFGRGVRHTKI